MMDGKLLVYPQEGQLYHFDIQNPTPSDIIPTENIITGDGYYDSRVVTVANYSLPGPPVIVYEGQMVTVHVHNHMASDAVTVHWHGLPQHGTPWMDGVAFITQCPILPGQKFTYRFKATPAGTFWYHSHIGAQRSMGLNGALIIREKAPLEIDEHILTIQDWNHDIDSDMAQMKMTYGNFRNGSRVNNTKSVEGASFSMFHMQSGLINGRGRYYDERSGNHNGAPLYIFNVTPGKRYRFRMIGTGVLYPWRLSIDNHMLTVIASDGMDIEPVTVQSIIINPGERYDFLLDANQITSNYWIRAKTLEINLNHTAEAILHYKGARDVEPTTSPHTCTPTNKCVTLNCPFTYFPPWYNSTCINADKFRPKQNMAMANSTNSIPLEEPASEEFLNFAFPGISFTPGSVNGRKFKTPPVSGLTQTNEVDDEVRCNDRDCGEDKICYCFNTLNLDFNKTYHLVFLNMGLGRGWAHPIHMHGHSFEILKMGFAVYDSNGQIVSDSPDIDCHGNGNLSFCNQATWSNPSWKGNNVPGLELNNPPRKDTVIIPSGGYAVVRIRSDNPGLWFLHCHIELHNLDGMAMAVNESSQLAPPPPEGFPECRNFRYDQRPHTTHKHKRSVEVEVVSETQSGQNNTRAFVVLTSQQFWTILALLIVVICLLLTTIVWLGLNRRIVNHVTKQ
ncbi:laccase-1-like [Pecten maximus]|uniref:laccase-1-like n=1 Tax=Pecten maximus TaxID=6579 RepID=UPI001458A9D9|nr:laccase-1-like [Pecten maximus]